jgi:L-threonylcarbamoyladenylate synthase
MPIVAPSEDIIARAVDALLRGEIVAFPTETVYGLGADARNADAVARVFAAKERPRFNPLIVHVPHRAAAETYAVLDDTARALAEVFWPGPLSLVVPKRENSGIADIVTAGLDTIALRVPNHPVAQALLTAAECPIAAPSANRSGHVSPTTAAHVEAELGTLPAMILDGGPAERGLESTVVHVTGEEPVLLRLGAVPREEIEAALGRKISLVSEDAPIASPGQLERHYAPKTPIRLDAAAVTADEALLAFGPVPLAGAKTTLNLSPCGDLTEAASNLFAALRTLDAAGVSTIAVMPIPDEGLGEAINDRLRRAAKAR